MPAAALRPENMIESSDRTNAPDTGSCAAEKQSEGVGDDPLSDHGEAYFTALFHKYRSSLFRYLTGLVSSPDDAAELVQESYTRLLQHDNVTQLEAVSRTYLFQIATNLARDHFRRRTTRRTSAHMDLDDIEIADDHAGPEQSLVWDKTIESIKQGIKELPPMTRRIFLLSRFRGKTYPQIAALLGISTRTVERKMSEAMQVLAERLGERP